MSFASLLLAVAPVLLGGRGGKKRNKKAEPHPAAPPPPLPFFHVERHDDRADRLAGAPDVQTRGGDDEAERYGLDAGSRFYIVSPREVLPLGGARISAVVAAASPLAAGFRRRVDHVRTAISRGERLTVGGRDAWAKRDTWVLLPFQSLCDEWRARVNRVRTPRAAALSLELQHAAELSREVHAAYAAAFNGASRVEERFRKAQAWVSGAWDQMEAYGSAAGAATLAALQAGGAVAATFTTTLTVIGTTAGPALLAALAAFFAYQLYEGIKDVLAGSHGSPRLRAIEREAGVKFGADAWERYAHALALAVDTVTKGGA